MNRKSLFYCYFYCKALVIMNNPLVYRGVWKLSYLNINLVAIPQSYMSELLHCDAALPCPHSKVNVAFCFVEAYDTGQNSTGKLRGIFSVRHPDSSHLETFPSSFEWTDSVPSEKILMYHLWPIVSLTNRAYFNL